MKWTVVMESWSSGEPQTRYARVFATYPEAKAHLQAIEGKWLDPAVKGDIIVEPDAKPKPHELSKERYWPGSITIEQFINTPVPFEFGGRVITYQVSPIMQDIEDFTFETWIFENYPVDMSRNVTHVGQCVVHHRNRHEARKYHKALVEMLVRDLPPRNSCPDGGTGRCTRVADMNKFLGYETGAGMACTNLHQGVDSTGDTI